MKNRQERYCIVQMRTHMPFCWNTGTSVSARNNAFISWVSLLARGGVFPSTAYPPDGRRVARRGAAPPGRPRGGRMMDQGEVSPNRLLEKAPVAILRSGPTEGGHYGL